MVNTGSFIPEKKGKTGMVRRKRKVYVLSYVAYTFFFGASMTVAGLFVWSLYLDSQIRSQSETLQAEQQRFSQSDLEQVREFDRRIGHVEALLKSTPFVSQILGALEAATPENIRFERFLLTQTGSDANGGDSFSNVVSYQNFNSYTLALEGTTNSFDKLLFQQSILKGNTVLTAATVDSLTYDLEDGRNSIEPVAFTITTRVPFSAINTMDAAAPVPEVPVAIEEEVVAETTLDDDGVLDDELLLDETSVDVEGEVSNQEPI